MLAPKTPRNRVAAAVQSFFLLGLSAPASSPRPTTIRVAPMPIFSNDNNSKTIAALLYHRAEIGIPPSQSDFARIRLARDLDARQAAREAARAQKAAANGHAALAAAGAAPPPECPMHKAAPSAASSAPAHAHHRSPFAAATAATGTMGGPTADGASACPVPHDQREKYLADQKLDPRNNMPALSQERAASQGAALSTERVVSSIPRARNSPAVGASPYDPPAAPSQCPVDHGQKKDGHSDEQDANWEYPSAQQFYNALVRKGWETPEEHVDMMVLIHNFLNERAWQEVVEWEKLAGTDTSQISLARFTGRPGTLSPRARYYQWLGALMPNKYNSEPPFDRHDWVVQRPPAPGIDGPGEQVRYVIDYYEAPPDDPEEDEAVFNLDVRPAVDSLAALRLRAQKAFDDWKQEAPAPMSAPSA